MVKLPFAKTYQDLIVYQKSIQFTDKLYKISAYFPKEETYSLTNQLRRSSRSIGAQVAEAWGKRPYPKHFKSKLTDGISETNETEHWINIAFRCGYIDIDQKKELVTMCQKIRQLLGGMISKTNQFCSQLEDNNSRQNKN